MSSFTNDSIAWNRITYYMSLNTILIMAHYLEVIDLATMYHISMIVFI